MGTLAFIFFPSPYNAFPVQATHEGFFLKCLVKTLEFLMFFLPCPVCWFISDRSCQAFQSHPVRREKKIKRSSRGWRGENGLDSYSQFSLMIRSSLACCCAGAHLGGDPAHLGWFMTRPCKCSPLHVQDQGSAFLPYVFTPTLEGILFWKEGWVGHREAQEPSP